MSTFPWKSHPILNVVGKTAELPFVQLMFTKGRGTGRFKTQEAVTDNQCNLLQRVVARIKAWGWEAHCLEPVGRKGE